MTRCIIIDDEPLARSIVREYLMAYPDIEVVEECNDGFEGVKAIMQHQPDLVFLDVQMPKINGFEMLEILDDAPAIIFTTAFDEYAIRAFEAHAVDYLLKPYSKERFDKALKNWRQTLNTPAQSEKMEAIKEMPARPAEEQQRVVVKNGSRIILIPAEQIICIEAYDDYVKIYTEEGMQLKKKTMAHFEQTLSAQEFLRVHRSYIVRLDQITKIEARDKDQHIAILKNNMKVSLSRTGYTRLKETLGI